MPGARTICVASLGLALCACQQERPGPRRAAPRALASLSSSVAGTPRVAPEIVDTLRTVREEVLAIVAPRVPPARLAFAGPRLIQATAKGVVFRDSQRGDVIAERELGGVFAVAHGSDGALFALGAKEGVRLESRATKPQSFPRAPFFPDSQLFPALESPNVFYVHYPSDQQLYQYSFASQGGGLSIPDVRYPYEGCIGALGALRDGAFVCRTQAGLLRKAPRGRRTDLPWRKALQEPIRFLPAKRLDEVFSIGQAGEVTHLRLTPGLPELGHFTLPGVPYAAAANEEALAFVLVSPPTPGQPRRWTLLVTNLAGEPRLKVELPTQAARADEAWVAAEVEDKNLAISGSEPLVTVGGAARLTVWSYATGQALFAR